MEERTRKVRSAEVDVPVFSPDSQCSSRCSSVPSRRQNIPPKRECSQRLYDQVDTERLELEKKKVQILQETSMVDKQFMQNVTNADYKFLMSLLPFIEPLTLMEKLDLREKLQKDVNDAYKKHEQRQQASPSNSGVPFSADPNN